MDPHEGPTDPGEGYYDQEEDHELSPDGQANNEEYDINFEEVSENDDIELLYAKLRASKKARERADEDAKLLENRIKLLKQEESKARKKISETKKRAKDIVSTKKRNVERQKQKKQLHDSRMQEENKLAVRNENMRNELKKRISHTNTEIAEKRREEAERLRQEKREQEELVEMYRQQEQLRNTSMKQMIRNNEKELEERRKREYAQKKVSLIRKFIWLRGFVMVEKEVLGYFLFGKTDIYVSDLLPTYPSMSIYR